MARINPFQRLYDICNLEEFDVKTGNVKGYPIIVDIELTNLCNLKCLMCPTGTGTIRRPRGFMDEEIFDKVVGELKNRDVGLRFIRWGEPLLHGKAIPFLRKTKEAGLLAHLNTNGLLLTGEMMREFIAMRLDSIKFSFQGVDSESYETMRSGGSFKALVDAMKELHALRGEGGLPFIHAATTVTYESGESVAEFKRMISSHADLVTVGRTKMEHLDAAGILDESQKERVHDLCKKLSLVKRRPVHCPEVFDKLSVNWDGTVTACCSDYDGKMLVGNVRDNTLEEIWNGEKMRRIQAILKNDDYDRLDHCRNCYDYMAIQTDDNRVD